MLKILENPIQMDDLGVFPLFLETSKLTYKNHQKSGASRRGSFKRRSAVTFVDSALNAGCGQSKLQAAVNLIIFGIPTKTLDF